MRTNKFSKKLVLNKQTVVNLSKSELNNVNGGGIFNTYYPCATEVEGCDTSTCYDTGILYTCTTSVPRLNC